MPIRPVAHALLHIAIMIWPTRDLCESRAWLIVKRACLKRSRHWRARLLVAIADDFIELSFVELLRRGVIRKRWDRSGA